MWLKAFLYLLFILWRKDAIQIQKLLIASLQKRKTDEKQESGYTYAKGHTFDKTFFKDIIKFFGFTFSKG